MASENFVFNIAKGRVGEYVTAVLAGGNDAIIWVPMNGSDESAANGQDADTLAAVEALAHVEQFTSCVHVVRHDERTAVRYLDQAVHDLYLHPRREPQLPRLQDDDADRPARIDLALHSCVEPFLRGVRLRPHELPRLVHDPCALRCPRNRGSL